MQVIGLEDELATQKTTIISLEQRIKIVQSQYDAANTKISKLEEEADELEMVNSLLKIMAGLLSVEDKITLPMAIDSNDVRVEKEDDSIFSQHEETLEMGLVAMLNDETKTWAEIEGNIKAKAEELLDEKVMTLFWDKKADSAFEDLNQLGLVFSVNDLLLVGFKTLSSNKDINKDGKEG